jgi:hypothetical protein
MHHFRPVSGCLVVEQDISCWTSGGLGRRITDRAQRSFLRVSKQRNVNVINHHTVIPRPVTHAPVTLPISQRAKKQTAAAKRLTIRIRITRNFITQSHQ